MVKDAVKSGLKLSTSKHFKHQGYDGLVVTYQSVAYKDKSTNKFINAEILAHICETNKVLVIADECHHLGDGKNWGDGFEIAFSKSVARLMTSGTPFRTDGKSIPWLRYHRRELDLSIPHAYAYGYGPSKWNARHCALGDQVVRDTVIHSLDSEITFSVSRTRDGITESETYTHRMSDNIDAIPEYECVFDEEGRRIEDNRALRDRIRSARREACLKVGTPNHPHGTAYVRKVLKDANEQLKLIREEHFWASGLIVCKDKEHADDIENALLHLTGEPAVVIYSGKGNEGEQIENFRGNTTRDRVKWLIAVGMISEGVNIPHLRVGVYMTDIQAAMKWTQILGRILRVEDGIDWEKQTAHFFQYDDGVINDLDEEGNESIQSTGIKLYAETLMQEREAHIRTHCEDRRVIANDSDRNSQNSTQVEAISTTDVQTYQIYKEERFENNKVEPFNRIAAKTGLAAAKLAYLVEVGGKDDWRKALNLQEV
tara:strand:- start:556 stop:2010 length:1455 start_codon:yes stop_codon:yes gene_type:complete